MSVKPRLHAAPATLLTLAVILALAALVASLAIAGATARASGATSFDSERPAGYDINPKHQSNWEPAVAVDPNRPNRVYQLITGINAQACKGNCPGTSVLFRRSTDGGASFGPESLRLRGCLQDDRVAVRPPDPGGERHQRGV